MDGDGGSTAAAGCDGAGHDVAAELWCAGGGGVGDGTLAHSNQ